MKQTPNYNLNKLEGPDTADLTQFNPNWDTLDTNLKQLSDDHVTHLAETVARDDVHGLKTLLQNQQFTNLIKNGDFASWSLGTAPGTLPDGFRQWHTPCGIEYTTNGYIGAGVRMHYDNSGGVSAVSRGIFSNIEVPVRSDRKYTIVWVRSGDQPNYGHFMQNSGNKSVGTPTSISLGGGWYLDYITSNPKYTEACGFLVGIWVSAGQSKDTIIDRLIMVEGELPVAFAKSPQDYVDKHVADYTNHGNLKNKLINGNFDIWQRGTNFVNSVTRDYTADRFFYEWWADGGVMPNIVISRQPVAASDGIDARYFFRITTDGAGSGFGASAYYQVIQHIENGVRHLCGKSKQLSASFLARSSIAGKKMGLYGVQRYGSGGSPSTLDIIPGTTFTLTTDWRAYKFTLYTKSLVGKIFGTNDDDFFSLYLPLMIGDNYSATRNGTTISDMGGAGHIDIAQVQLEEGEYATPFEQRPIGLELAFCQRYYERITNQRNLYITGFEDTLNNYFVPNGFMFKVSKRTNPTIIFNGDFAYRRSSSVRIIDNAGLSFLSITKDGFNIIYDLSKSALTAIDGAAAGLRFQSSSSHIEVDAEL